MVAKGKARFSSNRFVYEQDTGGNGTGGARGEHVPLAQACRAGQLRAAPPTCTAGRHALPPTSRGPGRWRCRRPPRRPRGEARTLGLTWPPGAATESLASPLFSHRSKVSIVFGNKRFHSGYTIVFSSGFHLQNIGILHR